MAIISYGKSTFIGNARSRRHNRRQAMSQLKQSIDLAFCLEAPPEPLRKAEQICKRKSLSRVQRAVAQIVPRARTEASFDNCCLPHVYLYAVSDDREKAGADYLATPARQHCR
ncbi:hypothetical protein J9874_02522 [Duffyella gerundensis]|jgi:hypothetical protein|uniref:Uncharacterized protein n=1 Tax=Duffyella gerundensis TaxID=1619313 RepID=A0A0U5L215_9GAMM|nr:hypothetical protein [Duffyella gerundensis]UCB31969.1 hypothetical protein J9874_02522 [Duffyella gerundensis]CUU23125.1 hypothetical protein EM595_0889 [Duffyella gerundensis]